MKHIKIAVIGLGYVGLPLARLFSTKYKIVGFDLNSSRVKELMSGYDTTLDVADDLLHEAISKHGLFCYSIRRYTRLQFLCSGCPYFC